MQRLGIDEAAFMAATYATFELGIEFRDFGAIGREALHSVVVVGGGLVGLCAAIGFPRALPHASVTLVATPVDAAALADRLTAVAPQVMERFVALGMDEVALVPGAALALAERFVLPVEEPRSLLSRFDYTLRLDAERAMPVLAGLAQQAGVRPVSGAALEIERDDHGVASVTAAGTRLTADLFVDASGPAALLSAPDAAWVDWSDTLPADRLLLASTAGRPSPTDSYEATGIGWNARWPLVDRMVIGLAYASAATSDARTAPMAR